MNMKIIINKMRIIIVQATSLNLEIKFEIFDTKEKNLFILSLLLKCEASGATSVMARGLVWIIPHLEVF